MGSGIFVDDPSVARNLGGRSEKEKEVRNGRNQSKNRHRPVKVPRFPRLRGAGHDLRGALGGTGAQLCQVERIRYLEVLFPFSGRKKEENEEGEKKTNCLVCEQRKRR